MKGILGLNYVRAVVSAAGLIVNLSRIDASTTRQTNRVVPYPCLEASSNRGNSYAAVAMTSWYICLNLLWDLTE